MHETRRYTVSAEFLLDLCKAGFIQAVRLLTSWVKRTLCWYPPSPPACIVTVWAGDACQQHKYMAAGCEIEATEAYAKTHTHEKKKRASVNVFAAASSAFVPE